MKNKIFFGTFLVALTACTFFYFNKIKKPQPSLTAYEQYLADHFYNKAADNITIEMPGETETEAAKTDRPDLAFEQDFRITMDPVLKRPATERLIIAREMIAMQQRNKQTLMAPIWDERGPKNVGGRTRTVVYDPNDLSNKKVWAGGVGGGLWYCNDITAASPIWNRVNDFWENIAISSIAFDPTNTQLMYVGTGEGWSNLDAQRGAGVWKSSNAGLGFERLLSTNNTTFYHVQKIVVNATGVYVGTKAGGVMRSTDGGTSFTKVLGSTVPIGASNQISDLEIGADGTIYAGIGIFTSGSVWKSISGNANTWTKLNNGTNGFPTSGFERVEIAVAPNDSNVLYAITQDASTNGLYNIYYSANKGTSWTTCAKPADADGGIPSDDFTRTQAWYDLTAAVDPNNASTILIGGVDLFKSTNAGTSWTQISHWYGGFSFPDVHADQHVITFKKNSSSEVLFGNDGGIYLSANINNASPTFSNKNNGYNVTQFYACAIHPTNTNYFLAGAQDNGSHKFSATGLNATTKASGGDGAYCHIDQTDGQIQVTSYVYNNYYYTRDGGATSFKTVPGGTSTTGQFINPTEYDDALDVLYTSAAGGTYGLVSGLAGTGNPSYQAVSVSDLLGKTVTAFKVDPNVPSGGTVWMVGSNSGSPVFVKLSNTNTNAPVTVTAITASGFTSGSWVSSIDVENGNPNHLLATVSNYGANSVMESTDGGTTWTNIEGANFPDMPVRWGIFAPANALLTSAATGGGIILATETGVWCTSTLNGTATTWAPQNTGMANVSSYMLKYRSSDRTLAVATHGRGLFTTVLPSVVTAINPTVNTKGFITSIAANAANLYIKAGNLTGIKNMQINVYDMQGRQLLGNNFSYNNQTIPLRQIPSGAYIVKVLGDKKEQYTQQFVK